MKITPKGNNRSVTSDDIKRMAQENPDLFTDPYGGSGSSFSVKPKGKTTKTSKKIQAEATEEKNMPNEDFYNDVFDSQEKELDPVEDESVDDSGLTEAQKQLLKAKKKFNGVVSSGDEEEIAENSVTSLYDVQAEKVVSTFNKQLATIKALENEILGYKVAIDRDFNGQWVVYKLPAVTKIYDPADNSLQAIGSGIFVDNNDELWYLNSDSNTKFLVSAGMLSDIVGLKKPEFYDLVKKHTPTPEEYILEGSDLGFLLTQPEFFENLGIKLLDAQQNLVVLTKHSRQDLHNMFLANGLNITLTGIYKTAQ